MIKFEILKNEESILVFSSEDKFDDFHIDINDFWEYVVDKGLNGYCEDYFDPGRSAHLQNTGELSFEQYFNLKDSEIQPDLEEYIFKKNLI